MKRSQCDVILGMLKRRMSVTPATAYRFCGTFALHSRVSELRGRGHRIECLVVRQPNGRRYGTYWLGRG